NLIESEMFGHVKGAFTGADRDRAGKFTDVGRGTLLLDDIDALPLPLQAKLLRAVEERVFEPVGSNAPQPMLARLIVASSRPLDREVAAGRFRADLYFRLNVVSFALPPLRDRRTVIRPLAFRFVSEYAARNGREVRGISPEAMRVLEGYNWPGNIRELRNTIERAVSLCVGRDIHVFDLPDSVQPSDDRAAPAPGLRTMIPSPPVARSPLAQIKEAAEVSRILEALERHKDNRLRAAMELGISRMTLYKKLHKYGLMSETSPRPQGQRGRSAARKLAQAAGGPPPEIAAV
ncbi:MAG TPA: sigma 54-interacting transcriptional regulator, partial [Isosphaeraceae bacterium]|nr:sigma 54-interacting transcriptional regulator [Isosphaeraceae bacterium]